MWCCKNMIIFFLPFLMFLLLNSSLISQAASPNYYKFVIKEAWYTRLCYSKKILTVNGQFPGPTMYAYKGQTIVVEVHNQANDNITLHWHGVKQPRNPWSDGPVYITQCPIQPGKMFRQKIILSDEEGTLWWHAHNSWLRATVYGAMIIYPKPGTNYPFPRPYKERVIILGEWWKEDIKDVLQYVLESGGQPSLSSAYLINGQPGDFYECSENETYELNVKRGKTYMLRIINAALDEIFYYAIANHSLTVVGTDASYTKPLTREIISITPGQTYDVLFHPNLTPGYYYMAANAYVNGTLVKSLNASATAVVKYNETSSSKPSNPPFPHFPLDNDTSTDFNFSRSLRSLASKEHPIDVPKKVGSRLFTTVSMNSFPCDTNATCEGPNGTRLAASMSNISFIDPSIDILEAYYYNIKGVYGKNFPKFVPYVFDFTAENQPSYLFTPKKGTEVRMYKYGTSVEMVLQGTSLLSSIDHPMHLHGYSFYVVGIGRGNFDKNKDPKNYNLVDPPIRNTVNVPNNGWVTIRFKTDNPGVWFVHCHVEAHVTWGMNTVFIVKDGNKSEEKMLPPPPDMPPC